MATRADRCARCRRAGLAVLATGAIAGFLGGALFVASVFVFDLQHLRLLAESDASGLPIALLLAIPVCFAALGAGAAVALASSGGDDRRRCGTGNDQT